MLNLPTDPKRAWAVVRSAEHDLTTMPLSELTAHMAPDTVVSVIQPGDLPEGVVEQELHVRENAQEFDVFYYRFPGYRGLRHGRGGNWILWSEDHSRFWLTETANDPQQTWIHTRFILRHLIIDEFLSRPGFRRLHAAAGTRADDTGLLIAGPYLSGKTYLLNALIEGGLLLDWVEDDCAVVDADLTIHALIPIPDAVRQTRKLDLSILLCLDKSCTHAERMTTRDALRWALAIQTPWPLSWLPHRSTFSADPSHFTRDLLCLRVPERPAPGDVIDALKYHTESQTK